MGSGKRRKRRTHRPQEAVEQLQGLPKSFVIARKKVPHAMRQLVRDFRQVMMPLTAAKLKERKQNSMKDFVSVAGPLGITHVIAFSYPDSGATLRICKTPHGPTLHFKILEYSLCSDVVRLQRRPHSAGIEMHSSPLLVLNNFGEEKHMILTSTMLHNLFPPVDVATIKLNAARRILLVHHDEEKDTFEVRHYVTNVSDSGLSKSLKKILQKKQLPNLGKYKDISEYITAEVSDSEADDPSLAQVPISKSGSSTPKEQATVRLTELGPRITMQLTKIHEGFCAGEVVYHRYVEKSAEEVAALRLRKEAQKKLKDQRKKAQEANIKKKGEKAADYGSDIDDYSGAESDGSNDDDAAWYRKEVGENPDEDEFPAAKKPRKDKAKSAPWFVKRRQKQKTEKPAAPASSSRFKRKSRK